MSRLIVLFVVVTFLTMPLFCTGGSSNDEKKNMEDVMELAKPELDGTTSVEEALNERRSIRKYKDSPLNLKEVSQLMWAAQGISSSPGFRTAPSAGATYPLEVYLVVGEVDGLDEGVYRYIPEGHKLKKLQSSDKRDELFNAALRQRWVKKGKVDIVISGIYKRTTGKYRERGIRYVHMEAGHAAQNIYLQSVSLGLATVTVGAFHDDKVKEILEMKEGETPLYIMPVGRK